MKLISDNTEKETNIIGAFLIILILLFANMPFYLGRVTFLGDPRVYKFMAGLYSLIFHEPFSNSTMLLMEKTGHPIFVFSLKSNIFSVLIAVITMTCLYLKKYRVTSIWFFLLSFFGFWLFYCFFMDVQIWHIGIDFLSEKLLLLISSCCSFIIGLRNLRILEHKQFNQQLTPISAPPIGKT